MPRGDQGRDWQLSWDFGNKTRRVSTMRDGVQQAEKLSKEIGMPVQVQSRMAGKEWSQWITRKIVGTRAR